MPTYEFRCSNGHAFDQFHKISDAPQTAACPVCGAEGARTISGGAGLVFKGSGFYLTDYGKNAHRTSGPASPAGGESGGGKSDAKGGDGGGKSADGGGSASGGTGSSGGGSSTGSTGGSGGGSAGGGSTGGKSPGGGSAGGSTGGGAA